MTQKTIATTALSLLCSLALCASGQRSTLVATDANGLLLAPTNFWKANAASIAAVAGTGGSGQTQWPAASITNAPWLEVNGNAERLADGGGNPILFNQYGETVLNGGLIGNAGISNYFGDLAAEHFFGDGTRLSISAANLVDKLGIEHWDNFTKSVFATTNETDPVAFVNANNRFVGDGSGLRLPGITTNYTIPGGATFYITNGVIMGMQ